MFPNYKGLSDIDKIAACIAFELSHGGNNIAAAHAILRDIERGYILPHLTLAPADAGTSEVLVKDILDFVEEEFFEVTKEEKQDLAHFLCERLRR